MEFMNRLTDKMGWETKVFDEALVAKWKVEALEAADVDISEKMVDWASSFKISSPCAFIDHRSSYPLINTYSIEGSFILLSSSWLQS